MFAGTEDTCCFDFRALPPAPSVGAGTALLSYIDPRFQLLSDFRLLRSANLTSYINELKSQDRVCSYYFFQYHAQNFPERIFLVYEDGRTWTYPQFLTEIHRIGNWLSGSLGVKKQEVVAVNFKNCPEYLMVWFALEALGATPVKINYNLTGQELVKCVQACKTRYIIVDSELEQTVSAVANDIQSLKTRLVYFTSALRESLVDDAPIPDSKRAGLVPEDMETLLFTSGTTGLPKATVMTLDRALQMGKFMARYLNLKPTDRIFTCMPMYHGAAHCFCTFGVLYAGCTLVLGHQFSRDNFWPFVRSSGATHIQHVGQMCRYLLAAPASPLDQAHKVKVLFGNLLRPQVWEDFRQRFNIPVVVEFYAASDGVDASFNWNTGAFGRGGIGTRGLLSGWLLRKRLIPFKVDLESGELLRDEDGFCIRCDVNEPGEALTELTKEDLESEISRRYYGNAEAGMKRVTHNVVRKGDQWFRTSDMMRVDRDGVFYFVDRLEDAFRWQSEKPISTNEVMDVLSLHPGIAEANVYGIEIPRHEGRCVCAMIVPSSTHPLDMHSLATYLLSELPKHAVPLFLRVVEKVELTGNLKMLKTKIKDQGADIERIEMEESKDGKNVKMYWLKEGRYVPYRAEDWKRLRHGEAKL